MVERIKDDCLEKDGQIHRPIYNREVGRIHFHTAPLCKRRSMYCVSLRKNKKQKTVFCSEHPNCFLFHPAALFNKKKKKEENKEEYRPQIYYMTLI